MEAFIKRLNDLAIGENDAILAKAKELSLQLNNEFSIAVIGDVSRGKSTLLNNLLRLEILPTGDIPTTKAITKVLFGKQERIVAVKNNNEAKVYSIDKLDAELWQQPDIKQFTLELNNENLHVTDAAFFDTPALDSNLSDDSRYSPNVIDLSHFADAVILVITASSPLSLENLEYLRAHVKHYYVPRLMIVLNYLDRADNGQIELLSSIHAKLKTLNVPYTFIAITSQPKAELRELLDGTTYSDIWQKTLEWTRSEEHRHLRYKQKLRQIQLLALKLKDSNDQRIAIDESKYAEREKERTIDFNQIQEKDSFWHSIEIKFEEKLRLQQQFVERKVIAYQPRLLDLMRYSIMNADDIQHWYNTELPFLLKGQLESLKESIVRILHQRVEADFLSIEKEINNWLEVNYAGLQDGEQVPQGDFETSLPLLNNELLKNHKRVTARAVTLATIVGFFVFGPIGAALSAGGGLITEIFTRQSIRDQKEVLIKRLEQTFNKHLHLLSMNIGDQLSKLYRTNINHLHLQAKNWKAGKLEELEQLRLNDLAIPKGLHQKREQILKLLEDINTAQTKKYGN